jgi:hypothetical protein
MVSVGVVDNSKSFGLVWAHFVVLLLSYRLLADLTPNHITSSIIRNVS